MLTEAVVEPLSDAQILAYLNQAVPAYTSLHAAVERDTALRTALETLLLLRVVMRTYRDLSPAAIPPVGNHDAWVQRLFQDYVAQMLKHHGGAASGASDNESMAGESSEFSTYSAAQITAYLAWLASEMRAHQLADFYVEQLQPDWLPDVRARRQYRVVTELVGGLVVGTFVGVVFGLDVGLLVEVVGGVVIGLDAVLAAALGDIQPVSGFLWSWTTLLVGLFVGLFVGLAPREIDVQESDHPNEGIHRSAITGLFVGVAVGLLVGVGGGLFVELFVGGNAWISHLALRWLLGQRGLIPPHLERFLDEAASKILLQRVGGGYRFIHPLLRDYFADLDMPASTDAATTVH